MMDIHMSVRSLVEFIYRYGDIDSTGNASTEESMLVGARIHRKIQSMAGSSYRAEYALSYSYESRLCSVTVEGRADGLIIEDTPPETELKQITDMQMGLPAETYPDMAQYVTIDEIKTTVRSIDRMEAPDPVHLAQAKVYAAIYLMAEDLPEIYVRMTYVHQHTEEIRYFYSRYTAEEITGWFDDTLEAMNKWLDMQAEWMIKRQDSIAELEFPFEYRYNLLQQVALKIPLQACIPTMYGRRRNKTVIQVFLIVHNRN